MVWYVAEISSIGRVCRFRYYWGRCGRVFCCRSLLGTMLKGMAVHFCTGDVVVDNGAVYMFLRKCLLTSPPQFWHFLS